MFNYYMPTNIYFGRDCLFQNGEAIRQYGKKALIVTGSSSAVKSGALADMIELLKKLDISYTIYSEIKENPTLESILSGAEHFHRNGCDLIIGIGGGSPVDAAKAISAVAANNIKGTDIYQPTNIKKAFPIIAVTTTSGTGTEATPYSVITDGEKKAGFGSPLMFPKVSFLDPKYTMTMPDKVTRDTAIDALSHLIEGLYSNKRCPLTYPLIFSGVRIIHSVLEEVMAQPDNYVCRNQLMIASLYGGMTIAQTSTTLQHSIGYPLTTKLGLSHGLANGIVMKHIMELYYPAIKDELDLLFAHLNCSREDFYKWLDRLGMDANLNLSSEFIDEAVGQIMQSRNMALNPVQVNEEQIKGVLAKL